MVKTGRCKKYLVGTKYNINIWLDMTAIKDSRVNICSLGDGQMIVTPRKQGILTDLMVLGNKMNLVWSTVSVKNIQEEMGRCLCRRLISPLSQI